MARGKRLAAALAFAVLFFASNPVEACSCASGIPLCESLWRMSAVFVGEAVAIADVEPSACFDEASQLPGAFGSWELEVGS
jgi:hypothetical protein